ncbi:MAG: hypothetical protein LBR88_02105 [Zoogloeaceae bacterium]|jgi:hypothetical protein|nr:hypothetical protein [Zoogloeaceae bacterium]
MTTITLELPDDVAERAREKGLLDPERFRELLEQALSRAANASEASPDAREFLARLTRTRGLWRHGDGLRWQRRQRDEWARDGE